MMGIVVNMRLCIITFLALGISFCLSEPPYSDWWRTANYPNDIISSLSVAGSAEKIAETLQANKSPAATFELGRLYYARGLYRQALAFFQKTTFGGDMRLLYIGLCNIVLGEPDSARVFLAKISTPNLRAWSSAGLARISQTIPASANDYPYITNFFVVKSDSTTQQKGFTLQFGAFADSSRAENLAKVLKDIGLSPYLLKVQIGDKTLFRVRAEHFSTKAEAEQAGAALGDQFIYMVVPEE